MGNSQWETLQDATMLYTTLYMDFNFNHKIKPLIVTVVNEFDNFVLLLKILCKMSDK